MRGTSSRSLLPADEHKALRDIARKVLMDYRSGDATSLHVRDAAKVMTVGLAVPKFDLACLNFDLRVAKTQKRKKK